MFVFYAIDFRSLSWGNLDTKNSFLPNNSFESYLINAVPNKSHCSPVVKRPSFVRVPSFPPPLARMAGLRLVASSRVVFLSFCPKSCAKVINIMVAGHM